MYDDSCATQCRHVLLPIRILPKLDLVTTPVLSQAASMRILQCPQHDRQPGFLHFFLLSVWRSSASHIRNLMFAFLMHVESEYSFEAIAASRSQCLEMCRVSANMALIALHPCQGSVQRQPLAAEMTA